MDDVYNNIGRYNKSKTRLFDSGKIQITIGNTQSELTVLPENLAIVKKWLLQKEQDMKDTFGMSEDAKVRNTKTLYSLLKTYLYNVLYWFNDKPLTEITEEDIRRVVRDLEEGVLLSVKGNQLSEITLKNTYSRMFKSDKSFFSFIEKDNIARKVIKRKINSNNKVRFFNEDTLRKICNDAVLSSHRMAYWLLFDTGVEVSALVQLRKSNFEKKFNEKQKKYYWNIHVGKDISKSTRQTRSYHIHFQDTNDLLTSYLEKLNPEDKLFNFDPPAIYRALKIQDNIHHYPIIGEIKNARIQTKDFRSSCACYFLGKGWSMEQINARLGHTISSRELDKYVSWLAIKFDVVREKDIKLDMSNYKEKYEELLQENNDFKTRLSDLEDANRLLLQQFKTFNRYMLMDAKKRGETDRVERLAKRIAMKDDKVVPYIKNTHEQIKKRYEKSQSDGIK